MIKPLLELPAVEPSVTGVGRVGKPRLLKANRQQVEMRLAALDDFLGPDHLARVIWALVEQMDLRSFCSPIQAIEGQAGHPAIDPAILIGLWLFATAEGVGSARELDRLCTEHLAYQWLCGGVSVNYNTLADFRVTHERELDALLTRQVAALMAAGLVSMERTTQDGVRIRASAGRSSFRRCERLEAFEAAAQAQVGRLKASAQTEDQPNPTRQQVAQKRAAHERLERVQQALSELAQEEQRQAKDHLKKSKRQPVRCSTTDPQARVMQLPDGGRAPAYNGQLGVDTGSGIIVGVDVINQVDRGQVTPMLEQIQERYDQRPKEHLVDGGFVSHAEVEACDQAGITLYAPVPEPGALPPAPGKSRSKAGPAVLAWRQRMQTEAAKLIYKLRAQTVEWANAGLRQRGLCQFRVRSLQKARSVLLWFALLHNLLRTIALSAPPAPIVP